MKRSAPKSDPEKVRAFVERGRRSSAGSLSPGETKRRKPMKRSQPNRDWTAAREKVRLEDVCRFCGEGPADYLQAAHIVGREHDLDGSKRPWVNPVRIVPLCAGCHLRYDPHTRGLNQEPLDLLPYLTRPEKRLAFEDCGYDAFAYLHRLTGQRFGPLGGGEGL